MEDKLLMRDEVPVELTWDLTRIYKSEDELWADLDKIGPSVKLRCFKIISFIYSIDRKNC